MEAMLGEPTIQQRRDNSGSPNINLNTVDYALSPEYQYPVALEETMCVIKHIYENAAVYSDMHGKRREKRQGIR